MRKNRTIVSLFTILVVILASTGCAPTFSHEALDRVERDLTFRELQTNPDRFQGKWVLLGGTIIDTKNTPQGTFIEVLQRPVDRQGRPRETDETEGRYIIESSQYLDPAVYHPGKRISLIGQVAGQEVRPLGEIHYRYPVVTLGELRLWEPRSGPAFSVGVGVGVYHRF